MKNTDFGYGNFFGVPSTDVKLSLLFTGGSSVVAAKLQTTFEKLIIKHGENVQHWFNE